MRYFLLRLLQLIPVLFGISLIVFLSLAFLPGDPAQAILGAYATPDNVEALRTQMGLDQSLPIRYFTWLSHLFQGDMGQSYSLNKPVLEELGFRLGPTLLLAGAALLIAIIASLLAGVAMAVYQFGWVDRILSIIVVLGISLPAFWLAMMVILLFAVEWMWFPVSGMYHIVGDGGLGELFHHLVLPAIVLASVPTAVLSRLTRTTMLETLREDYIQTARAKGIRENRVIFRHALINALLGLVPVIATQVGFLLGGAVYVEMLFQWPGMGRMLVQAVASRDLLLVQGGVLVIATLYVGVNLCADLVQRWIDPRIRA